LLASTSQKSVVRKVKEKVFMALVDDWQQPPNGYVPDESDEKLPFLQVDFAEIASKLGSLASSP
jgi:hypothetical protein